jgi:quercetin dioxygenase-like cupin family protein
MLNLERAIATLPPAKIETSHHFSPGIYARELFIPKGCVLTGKIHRHAHLNILAQGRIMVRGEGGTQIVTAPAVIPSLPGVKRAGYALEDSTWITIHATDETDLEKLEELFIVTDVAEWESLAESQQLVPRADDWSDCPIVEEGIEE